MAVTGFQRVADPQEQPDTQTDEASQQAHQATQLLALALKALGQRALVALSNLFSAACVLSAWWLWFQSPADPSTRELVGLGLYGAFILALHVIRGRG